MSLSQLAALRKSQGYEHRLAAEASKLQGLLTPTVGRI
jgi:hypothetical protein